MSFERKLKRQNMKKQLKELKKTDPRFKNLKMSEFKDLWTQALISAQKEASASELTENLDDLFVKEVKEDEVTTSEQENSI